jgi:nucleoside-diphosphate-sugar epimerase
MSTDKMLVVGGAGFIGHALCQTAQAKGHTVTSLSMHAPTKWIEGVDYLVGNISDRALLKQLLAGKKFEYLVNCGGYIDHRSYFSGGREVIEAHFEGVQNLLDAVDRNCLKRFVQIGSGDEYGDAAAPQFETTREAPISPYSLAKVATTHFLQMLWRTEQFPAVTLRIFLAYGPGQGDKRFLPQIIRGCLQNYPFSVSEGGQLRDFCYVEDVVEGILCALYVPEVCGQVINLASGIPVSIRSMIEQVCVLVGKGQPDFGKIPYRKGENMALWANTQLACKLLDWTPQVPLEEGLIRTIAHYKKEYSAI